MFPVVQLGTIAASLLLALPVALSAYNPPDVGGPGSSQGSGTRYIDQSISQPAKI